MKNKNIKNVQENEIAKALIMILADKNNEGYVKNIYDDYFDDLKEFTKIEYFFQPSKRFVMDVASAERLRKSIAVVTLHFKWLDEYKEYVGLLDDLLALKEEKHISIEDDGLERIQNYTTTLRKNLNELVERVNAILFSKFKFLKKFINGNMSFYDMYFQLMNIDMSKYTNLEMCGAILGVHLNFNVGFHGDEEDGEMIATTAYELVHNVLFEKENEITEELMQEAIKLRRELGINNAKTLEEIESPIVENLIDRGKEITEADGNLFDDSITRTLYMIDKALADSHFITDTLYTNKISKKEINLMLCQALSQFPREEMDLIMGYLWLRSILSIVNKSFENDVKHYFKNSDDVLQLQEELKEKDDKKKDREIKRLEKLLEQKEKEVQRAKKESEKSIILLEKQISEKNDLVQSLETALIDSFDTNIDEDTKTPISASTSVLDKKVKIKAPISIIGGYPSLITRLKENIPNLKWVDSISKINKTDVNIVFLTNLSTHGQRYKLDSLNADVIYINSQTPNTILNELNEKLNNKK